MGKVGPGFLQAFCGDVHLGVGGNVNVSVGPIGREASACMCMGKRGYAMVYSYSCSRGVFCGVSVSGTVTSTRASANLAFYGRPLTAKDLLRGGGVDAPPAARSLYNALDRMINSFAYGDLQRPQSNLSVPWFSPSPTSSAQEGGSVHKELVSEKASMLSAPSQAVTVPDVNFLDAQGDVAGMSPSSEATAAMDMLDVQDTGLECEATAACGQNGGASSVAATDIAASADEDDGLYIHDLFD